MVAHIANRCEAFSQLKEKAEHPSIVLTPTLRLASAH